MKFWLQFIWLLPATILCWLLYILPLWALGYISYYGKVKYFLDKWHNQGFVLIFQLVRGDNWYSKLWRGWWGWSGPMVMIIHHHLFSPQYIGHLPRTILHESMHNTQHLRWGIFFYPVYVLRSAWIYFFNKDKHPYLDNPFEREARVAAKQQEFFLPSEWRKKNDKWPWW